MHFGSFPFFIENLWKVTLFHVFEYGKNKINHFKNMNVNFLLVAWRGFSGNKGQPTEEGLYEDARSAVSWLKSKGVLEKNIVTSFRWTHFEVLHIFPKACFENSADHSLKTN